MQQEDSITKLVKILDHTKSVCPICLRVVPGEIMQGIDKEVYLQKTCPDHGVTTTHLWPDVRHYHWMKDFRMPLKSPEFPVASKQGCPSDCGLCTSHLRHPTLVEIAVTERCNLRCPVCFMGAEEVQNQAPPDPDLQTFKRLYQSILQKTGPQTSIQLTGGEPTVRKDLPEIVRLGREIGFEAIEINTNGLVIGRNPQAAQELAEAGTSGIYLQFDGLSRSVYKQIRGEDLLEDKLRAIENCRSAGVQVVLAMTVIWGINHDQLGAVLGFALENQDVIAGIAYQPAFGSGRFEVSTERSLTMGDVIFMLAEQSSGIIEPYDIWPLGCSHPLCSSSTYLVREQEDWIPFTRKITPRDYQENFDTDSPQGSVFADIAIKKFPDLDPGLSIVIMNYMDAMNLDLQKLKECSMIVAKQDGSLVPFCSCQLTRMG